YHLMVDILDAARGEKRPDGCGTPPSAGHRRQQQAAQGRSAHQCASAGHAGCGPAGRSAGFPLVLHSSDSLLAAPRQTTGAAAAFHSLMALIETLGGMD